MAIRKTLTKLGNSSALVIDRPVLDLLNITNSTPLEITLTKDGSLLIRPIHDEDENGRMFEQAVASGNQRYGKMLKKLADK